MQGLTPMLECHTVRRAFVKKGALERHLGSVDAEPRLCKIPNAKDT